MKLMLQELQSGQQVVVPTIEVPGVSICMSVNIDSDPVVRELELDATDAKAQAFMDAARTASINFDTITTDMTKNNDERSNEQ